MSFVLLLFLGGCSTPKWPVQTQIRAEIEGPKNYKRKLSPEIFRGATAVDVGKGDSVYVLSRRHGVSMRAIISANNLQPPFFLQVGQRIILPRESSYTVKEGDTISEIATRKNVGMYELVRLNDLKPPYMIYTGHKLKLPVKFTKPGTTKTLVSGLKDIKTIAVSPKIRNLETKQQGDELSVPQKLPTWAKTAEGSGPKVNLTRSQKKTPNLLSIPKPAARSGKKFLWPVRGRVISAFGAKSKGLRNDGINISAPRGTLVLAAENGIVVYAGNELRGFGKLILVKHSGGWVSAYAHNQSFMVKRGEKVIKGQGIARVGSTGGVISPQLHFELRKGRIAKDPRKYLQQI